jgi:thioredoxin 1
MRILCVLLLAVTVVSAAERPYDEAADAKADIRKALVAATNTPVIVVFGANWCPDCLALNTAMKQEPSAALLGRDFRFVKVDIGRMDKNVDVAQSYGVPLKKGIPAVAILSPKGKVLYVTREGELADARKMGNDRIYEFFKTVTASWKETP